MQEEQGTERRVGGKGIAAIGVAVAVSVGAFLLRDSIGGLASLGYVGVFLLSLLGNATLVLPMPALVFVFAAGGALPSPLLVGLAAGAGATIGELTGYLAGLGGRGIVSASKAYNKLEKLVDKFGAWIIGALAFIPNPLFDLAGIAAGALKIRWHKFILATFVGKLAKMLLIAYAGHYSVDWVKALI